ncbi:helix-turn-helix transcriptional regulator [Blastopirellula retiformator]|nr:winged helix-turn-helix transcriptional regulator [Blastopirellula retiformator]
MNATEKKSGKKAPAASREPSPAKAVKEAESPEPSPAVNRWTFLTNHSHVLIVLSRDPTMVLRHVATEVGITERAVQRIIADLEEEGFLVKEKIGRQNTYRIILDRSLRHPIESHRNIGDLLKLVSK